MVRSVTDTTTDMVPSADGPLPPRTRWWAWVIASVGVGLLAAIGVAALLPSTLVSEQENERTGEMEPTPYALTPASADPVNERIEFGELPEGVERYAPSPARRNQPATPAGYRRRPPPVERRPPLSVFLTPSVYPRGLSNKRGWVLVSTPALDGWA